jgi:flagellar motor switch protein FliG
MSDKKAGVQAVVDMFAVMDPAERERLLKDLAERDPGLVEQIERGIFSFERLVQLGDSLVRELLKAVEPKRLALALKKAPEDVEALIFRNLSERAGAILKEEIQALGPQRLTDVKHAQAEIAKVAHKLLQRK